MSVVRRPLVRELKSCPAWLGVARVMSPDVRFGHRSAFGSASMASRSLGENGAPPSGLRLFSTPSSMTRVNPSRSTLRDGTAASSS